MEIYQFPHGYGLFMQCGQNIFYRDQTEDILGNPLYFQHIQLLTSKKHMEFYQFPHGSKHVMGRINE